MGQKFNQWAQCLLEKPLNPRQWQWLQSMAVATCVVVLAVGMPETVAASQLSPQPTNVHSLPVVTGASLTPVQTATNRGAKHGFMASSGTMVIPARYDDAKPFAQGLAAVKQGSLWGFITVEGKWAIEPRYKDAMNFSEGLAAVQADNGKWGFINMSGLTQVAPRFSGAMEPDQYKRNWGFHEGLAFAYLSQHRCGYINTQGQFVIPPRMEYCDDFSEGLAGVYNHDQMGYINKAGEFVIETYASGPFRQGLALTYITTDLTDDGLTGYYTFINKQGQPISNDKFEDAQPFQEGLAAVQKDGQYGFINAQGQWVIPPQYRWVSSFNEGKAAFMVGHNAHGDPIYGYIDPQGQVLIQPRFQWASVDQGKYTAAFRNGVARVEERGGLTGYINTQGQYLYSQMSSPVAATRMDATN